MIDDKPIDYESEHNKAINKLVKLRQKYDELEEDRDYVKSLLDVEFEKRIKLQKDCEKYRLELKQKNIEIQELKAYNTACEDTLLDIEVKFHNEITRIRNDIQEWKELDPNCDTTCMEHHLVLLEKFRKEIFKNDGE